MDWCFISEKAKNEINWGRIYRRIKDHLSLQDNSNKFKTNIIRKIQDLGLEITFNIVKDDITEKEAFLVEIELIKKYGKRIDGTGILVNLTNGGEGISGKIVSKKTRKILSDKAKERFKINGVNFKGCKHTQKTRELMSKIQKEIFKTRLSPMKGKRHTEESKRKMSESQKGKVKLPQELWYKFGHPGDKNSQARKYLFVNPAGKVFEVNGNFKGFIDPSSATCANNQ